MSDNDRRKRQEMGLKARDIFTKYTTSATKQLKEILTSFKLELVDAKIMTDDAIDLGMFGVGQLQLASNLYSIVVTTVEVMPSKFPDVVAIFYKFPELSAIAEEIEEKGFKHFLKFRDRMCWYNFLLG